MAWSAPSCSCRQDTLAMTDYTFELWVKPFLPSLSCLCQIFQPLNQEQQLIQYHILFLFSPWTPGLSQTSFLRKQHQQQQNIICIAFTQLEEITSTLHIYRKTCYVETTRKHYATLFKRLPHLCLLMSLWVQDPVSSRYRKKRATSRMGCTEHTVSKTHWVSMCGRQKANISYAWSWEISTCSCLKENVHREF